MLSNNEKFLEICKELLLNNSTKIFLKESEEFILMSKLKMLNNGKLDNNKIAKLYYELGYSNRLMDFYEINGIYKNCLNKIDKMIRCYGIDALEKLSQIEEVNEVSQGCLTRKRILELLIENNIKIVFDEKLNLLCYEEKLKLPIDNLNLQSCKKLEREKINTVSDLINFYDISKVRGLNVSEYMEIIEKLYGLGFINNKKTKARRNKK